MMNRGTLSLLLPLLLWTAAPSAALGQDLEAALAGAHRAPENAARDRDRHPAETLRFFGLRADMQVLEITPGRGWYTEVLAPFLAPKGKLTVASFGTEHRNDYLAGIHRDYAAKLAADPDTYGRVHMVSPFQKPAYLEQIASDSMDLVLTFRNTHNWIRDKVAQSIYRACFRVLRPGGTLGVVQHRAPPGTDAQASAQQGYVSEEYVVQLAEQAGFRLQDRSEINANPRDTRDYPKGVWTLPPTLRLEDQDRDKYLAIGESDRMTLKFVKPKT